MSQLLTPSEEPSTPSEEPSEPSEDPGESSEPSDPSNPSEGDTTPVKTEVFVSADAEEGKGDGSIDNPYASILEAKVYIREVKADDSYPEEGITVYFREGQYRVDETILFEDADSGDGGQICIKCNTKSRGHRKNVFSGGGRMTAAVL